VSTYNHEETQFTQLEKQIDFRFDDREPMLPTNYPTEYFAVKWVGMLLAPTTETYRLSIEA